MQDEKILDALRQVIDPELGINIVDFGMVYRAAWTTDGIEVSIGVPSTCPAMGVLIEDARATLRRQFPQAATIRVELATDETWSIDRMSEDARCVLGWIDTPAKPVKPRKRTTSPTPRKRTAAPRTPPVERPDERLNERLMPAVSTRWKN